MANDLFHLQSLPSIILQTQLLKSVNEYQDIGKLGGGGGGHKKRRKKMGEGGINNKDMGWGISIRSKASQICMSHVVTRMSTINKYIKCR